MLLHPIRYYNEGCPEALQHFVSLELSGVAETLARYTGGDHLDPSAPEVRKKSANEFTESPTSQNRLFWK